MPTIILTGGGTAGHCLPNVSLLPNLKKNFDKIYYVGSRNGIEKNISTSNNLDYYEIDTAKLKRKLTLSNLKIPVTVLKGIVQAKRIIKKTSPDVIFSKGGYVSIPMVIAGYLCKVPVISHESDLSVGLANKIASKFSKKVLTSFPETAEKIRNGVYVGPPIRNEIFNVNKTSAYARFGFFDTKPIILITGGSQGSKKINTVIDEVLPILLEKYNVIHLRGKGNLSNTKYPGYFQSEYINDIENAFAITTICITRGGSNTLFELLSLKIPCVVVPLPKEESRGDQILNAQYFSKKNAVTLLYQEKLQNDTLLESIDYVYQNKEKIQSNIKKLSIKSSNDKICKILTDYVKQ